MTDLPSKIRNWLNEQGYPLEMAVAKEFQAKQFSVTQSEYFTDSESGDSREIDVVSSKHWEIDDILCRVSIVAECKVSPDKPWILFATDKTPLATNARVSQRASSIAGRLILRSVLGISNVASLPLFRVEREHGYSLTQAFSSGNDIAYKAVMSATKAAHAMGLAADKIKKPTPRKIFLHRTYARILFPTVVVAGKIFRCTMNPILDDLGLTEIPRGVLVWRNPVVGLPHSIIHIVAQTDLPSFVADVDETITGIRQAIEGNAKETFRENIRSLRRHPGQRVNTNAL